MASSIVEFWRQCSGAIHPTDADVLATAPSLFNLDFPPPAYVGDIENAKVILLNGNGGYKPAVTPREFPDLTAVEKAINRLHHPTPIEKNDVCSYYADANYTRWLQSGELAMVNAIAYRAPEITERMTQISKKLPSTLLHIHWLRTEVMTAARAGKRLIIAHRNRLWALKRQADLPGVHFTSNPQSPHLANRTLGIIEQYLSKP
jgi:hypothetical protein